MTEAMPFLQKYDITFLRPPALMAGGFFVCLYRCRPLRRRAHYISILCQNHNPMAVLSARRKIHLRAFLPLTDSVIIMNY